MATVAPILFCNPATNESCINASNSQSVNTPLHVSFTIGPVLFSGNDIVAVVGAMVVASALALFMRYSKYGLGIRAAAENSDRATLLGISVARLDTIIWVLAAVLSTLAILLQVPVLGFGGFQTVTAGGDEILLRILAAAVIGRMESMPRTVVAALAIGVFDAGATWTYSNTTYVDASLVVVIVVALLLQRRSRSRVTEGEQSSWRYVASVRPIPRQLASLPEVRWTLRVMKVAFVAVVALLPLLLSDSQTYLASLIVVYAIVGLSLLVLTGWTGQISLGQFGLAGIGGATTVVLYSRHGWDFFAALALGVIVGALVSLFIGLPALRMSGPFLAVTTLAFGVTASSYFLQPNYLPWFVTTQANRPTLFGASVLNSDAQVYYFCLAGFFLVLLAVRSLRQSRTGRDLIATRDNEPAARAAAVNTTRYKLLAFAISGGIAGFAGSLFAVQQQGDQQRVVHRGHQHHHVLHGGHRRPGLHAGRDPGRRGGVGGPVLPPVRLRPAGQRVGHPAAPALPARRHRRPPQPGPGPAPARRGPPPRDHRSRDLAPARRGHRRRRHSTRPGNVCARLRWSARPPTCSPSASIRAPMADLTHPPLRARRPSRLTGTHSPRPLIAVMGLGAILPMSALTFVLLLPEMQDAYQPGPLHPGPGRRPAGADGPRPRPRPGPGGQPDLADQGPGRGGRILHRRRRRPVAGRRVPQPDPALRRRHRGGARRRRADLDPELPPLRLLPGQPATACDPGPADGPRVRPHPVPAHGGRPGLRSSAGRRRSSSWLPVPSSSWCWPPGSPDPVPAGGLPGGDPDHAEPPAEPATLPEAARVIATTRSLRLIYYSLPFLLGTVLGLTFYATAYYENVFHQDAAHRALLFGLAEPGAVIGLVVGTVFLPRRIAADPGQAMRTIAWLAVAAAAGAACLALAPDVAAAYAAQLVFAGASAVVIAGVYAMLSVALPTRMITLGFGLSTVWLTFGALLIGPPGGVPTINSLITDAFGYRASFWLFVPLFVIGASLLRSASRFVAEDIAKRKITEAGGCRRATGTGRRDGPSPHDPLARCRL